MAILLSRYGIIVKRYYQQANACLQFIKERAVMAAASR
jgi:hypothetical protein